MATWAVLVRRRIQHARPLIMCLKNGPGRVVSWVVRLYGDAQCLRTPGREITLYRKFNFVLIRLTAPLRGACAREKAASPRNSYRAPACCASHRDGLDCICISAYIIFYSPLHSWTEIPLPRLRERELCFLPRGVGGGDSRIRAIVSSRER